jgi:putative hemolysin
MITTILTILLIVTFMIGANALYVAGEFAAVSARKTRIQQMAAEGNSLAKSLLGIIESPERLDNYIAASQVGITLSSIVLGIYGQNEIAPLLTPFFAQPAFNQIPFLTAEGAAGAISATLVLVTLTILQVVLGELVPKSIAVQYPERVALWTLYPMRWSAEIIFRPLIALLNGSGAFVLRLFGLGHHGEHTHVHSPEEIEILVTESQKGGILDAEESKLVHNAFRLGELIAAQVMIPRIRITAISNKATLTEALKLAAESSYTRLLVYEGTLDNVVGYVHLRDLYRVWREKPNAPLPITQNIPYVPETALAQDVWQKLSQSQRYLAIVMDEYGGTAGMITQEDLLEELFGDFQDEFDQEAAPTRLTGDGRIALRGDMHINAVNDLINSHLPTDHATTIGGLVLEEMGRVPDVGDSISVNGLTLRVEAVAERAVREVSIVLPEEANGTEG